ncbi:glycoside hydrolase family 5 protein [Chitinophagaceae bacterium LWZ2-11]
MIHSSVKVKIIRLQFLFVVSFLFADPAIYATGQYNNPQAKEKHIKNNLYAGVNLSLYEHYWEKPDTLLQGNITSKLQEIRDAGFTCVRLPVAFDLFLQHGTYVLRPELIQKLKDAYATCTKLDLSLIITYHYGKLDDNNGFEEREKIISIWKQVQNVFKDQGGNDLLFDLYNEPTVNRNNWKRDISYIAKSLRTEDANRYYVIGGTNYNSIDELMEMGKLDVDKILYEFHFYEPFIFTHQGADWTEGKTNITNLPYPYKSKEMPKLSKTAKGTVTEDDYDRYPTEATRQYVRYRLKSVVRFCKRRKMPVICTETGAINIADDTYRENYFADITSTLYDLNVPTIFWDYDQKFSLNAKSSGKLLKSIRDWLKAN